VIISKKHKYVCFLPPKTGTSSMIHLLKKYYDGVLWEDWGKLGMKKRKVPRHFSCLLEEMQHYFVFSTVRNPYSHEISRFRFRKEKGFMAAETTFDDWINCMDSWRSIASMTRYGEKPIPGCVKVRLDYFVKLENFESDFRNLPFVKDMIKNIPHRRHNKDYPYPIIKQWHLEKIYKVRKVDFDLFDYPKEPPEEVRERMRKLSFL